MAHASLAKLLAAFSPDVRDLALRAREIILRQYPGAIEKLWAGWKMVGYGTGAAMTQMVCGVSMHRDQIHLHFTRGEELADPHGLLEGRSRLGRHVKIDSRKTLEADAVQALIQGAFELAQPRKPAQQAAGSEKVPKPDARYRRMPAGPLTDDVLQARTGKSWAEWFELLDSAGAYALPHAQIVVISGKHGAPAAWRQAIATSYEERARGRREQQAAGGYQVGATKTVTVPVAVLYDAWTDARRRRRWLSDARFTVRKATPSRALRITWSDESDVDVIFYPRGEEKSQVTVDHRKLAPRDVARMKEYWSEHLARLKEVLES